MPSYQMTSEIEITSKTISSTSSTMVPMPPLSLVSKTVGNPSKSQAPYQPTPLPPIPNQVCLFISPPSISLNTRGLLSLHMPSFNSTCQLPEELDPLIRQPMAVLIPPILDWMHHPLLQAPQVYPVAKPSLLLLYPVLPLASDPPFTSLPPPTTTTPLLL